MSERGEVPMMMLDLIASLVGGLVAIALIFGIAAVLLLGVRLLRNIWRGDI